MAFLTAATLSSGNSSDCTSSIPTSFAMMRADAALSPVSMDSSLMPSSCRRAKERFVFARGTSRSTMRAASLPSIATYAAISSGASGANSEFAVSDLRTGAVCAASAEGVMEGFAAAGCASSDIPSRTPRVSDSEESDKQRSLGACSTGMNPDSSAVAYAKRPTRTRCPFTSPETPLPESSTMFFTTG